MRLTESSTSGGLLSRASRKSLASLRLDPNRGGRHMPQPVPEGYSTLMPYLAVEDASAAIDFYQRAFGAKERSRMDGPGGAIIHAELEIGDSVLMLSDPLPQQAAKSPKQLGGITASPMLYVENVDEVVQQAVDAGATITAPVEDQFWG